MTYGSVFTGAGLGDFGFELAGFECKWQIENDKFCRKILDLRWPKVKKYGDIKKVKTAKLEKVDLITGGFPCQPFSVAGKGMGEDDDRNLWPEMFRIVKDLKPRWVVAENVPGIIPIYLDTILSDLESAGYTCWSVVFSSHSLGAWHKRERLWIIAITKFTGTSGQQENPALHKNRRAETQSDRIRTTSEANAGRNSGSKRKNRTMADTERQRLERSDSKRQARSTGRDLQCPWRNWWSTEPSMGRVVNGCANRVDRLKALGNGQTPCSTFLIGEIIKEINNES